MPGDCRTIRAEAKTRMFESIFQLVCRSIAVAMDREQRTGCLKSCASSAFFVMVTLYSFGINETKW